MMPDAHTRPTPERIEEIRKYAKAATGRFDPIGRMVTASEARDLLAEIDALRADCKALAELATEWASFVTALDEFSDEGSSYYPAYFPDVLAKHRVSSLRESPEVKAALARHGSTTP